MTIYGFRNQNYSKTGGYGQPYPYNGTQNESVNQWNYQPNNYLMQHNELPSRRTQATIFYDLFPTGIYKLIIHVSN